jgi:endoglucanase
LFYEAQRSGALPSNNRVSWRANSSLGDRGNGGEDLTGGYHDGEACREFSIYKICLRFTVPLIPSAGDYVKFGFPMAGAMTILAYGGITYSTAYEVAGEMGHLREAVKWGTDYLLKAHVSPTEFYCQVGNGDIDHAYPGRPETMTVERPAYSLTPSRPGSDCAGESAAALASASLLFRESDLAYSATLLEHARQLFNFADTYRGIYSDSIPDAAKFYM